ncbi:MAG: hypothetical protein LW729_04650 [Bacteroidetes bacterium]|nr:hypothetical protein [Bacteroidota bacterium]
MPRNFWFLTLLVFGSIFPQLGWSQISVTVGSGTLQNTPTSYPAPYGNFYWGARHQMIIRASELNALGVSGGGLTSVGFMVVTPSGIPLQNFTISIGTTSDSVLSTNAGFVSGMTQVYSVPTYTQQWKCGLSANRCGLQRDLVFPEGLVGHLHRVTGWVFWFF